MTRSNASVSRGSSEYKALFSIFTYAVANATSPTAIANIAILVTRSPVQNSGGVNDASGHIAAASSSMSSYRQFPTLHVTANDGITPGCVQ